MLAWFSAMQGFRYCLLVGHHDQGTTSQVPAVADVALRKDGMPLPKQQPREVLSSRSISQPWLPRALTRGLRLRDLGRIQQARSARCLHFGVHFHLFPHNVMWCWLKLAEREASMSGLTGKNGLLLFCRAFLTLALEDAPSFFSTWRSGSVNAVEACVHCEVYPFAAWGRWIRAGTCEDFVIRSTSTPSDTSKVRCAEEYGIQVYRFPSGIFEIDEQLLIPPRTSIIGARDPNHWAEPTKTPNWEEQTLFLATRGVTDYNMVYCHAADMVTTRVGFVLSSYVTIRNVSYQGIDTIRPNDNGALCGGAAFETKGCAENSCAVSGVNNGGSDGIGSIHVTIENVRLNDFFFAEDQAKVGASIPGNTECNTEKWTTECCFCKPNGVRSTQVGVWVPETRNREGTRNVLVRNLVSRTAQADAINLHGNVQGALVESVHFENTGDDMYVLWGANSNPANVTFRNCAAVNPGIMRPNWYGNCAATYGLKSVTFDGISCRAPAPEHPIQQPETGEVCIDTSMFVFYTSFGGDYPIDNNVTIKNWTFQDLKGNAYTPAEGSMDVYSPGKMVWTRTAKQALAPFYLPNQKQQVNVHVI